MVNNRERMAEEQQDDRGKEKRMTQKQTEDVRGTDWITEQQTASQRNRQEDDTGTDIGYQRHRRRMTDEQAG